MPPRARPAMTGRKGEEAPAAANVLGFGSRASHPVVADSGTAQSGI
jgi:hypothetical protein